MEQIHVVIVDDEQQNRKLLERALQDDFQIHSFDSGEMCLNALDNLEADVFLLDVRMPGGSWHLRVNLSDHFFTLSDC